MTTSHHPASHEFPRSERGDQLTLFTHGAHPKMARRKLSRTESMALRLDQLADDWDDDAEAAHHHGDQLTERRMREQARDARRSAAILRAGPEGVGRLLAS